MRGTAKGAALMVVLAGLGGCGGDDDAAAPEVNGRLLDSEVAGVQYAAAPSGKGGTTGSQGEFVCLSGDTVSFSVGGIALGQAACGATVTPIDFAGTGALDSDKLVNRLLFLQMLDEDDDPGNGIRIAPALVQALAGKSLDFNAAAADFGTALVALLPAAVQDAYGQPYAAREAGQRRPAAVEHFEGTLAAALGQSGTSRSSQASAGGEVSITKYMLHADASVYVPYEGSNAAARKDFAKGFYPAAGSGLAFKGKAADGSLEFWGITDRGPNGDSPNAPWPDAPASSSITKMFPAPSFTPSIGTITVGAKGAVLGSLMPLKLDAATRISGRPPAAGAVGSSGEIPLDDSLKYDPVKGAFDNNGLDSESLVYDAAAKVFWTSDEYGPFIAKIEAATGVILKRYAPGPAAGDLPDVLKHRRANRGMEGLTLDTASGHLHGFLQSPIDPFDALGKSVETTDALDLDQDGKTTDKVKLKDFAQFARWIEFDPASETSKLYAYPLSYALSASGGKWDRNRTGSAKLGDVVSLGGGKFVLIEQGADSNGAVRNFLMLVELPADATDIAKIGIELEKNSIDGSSVAAVSWNNVVKMKKTLLLDLNAAGWMAEKAEGLTLVDSQTLALINDNDFGLRSILVDAAGKAVDGDPTACSVDVNGTILNDGACAAGAVGVRVTRASDTQRATRLWLLKFPKALSSFSAP